mmetsp:Transcript_5942/g.13516  ORF Transcript_5942/g.13516 Transcript_5942/m.13516 type:complete len:481 (-) Transcript_5942:58-1500(-)
MQVPTFRVLLAALCLGLATANLPFFKHPTHPDVDFDLGLHEDPLILTGMDPAEARNKSAVTGQLGALTQSYSGFFTTDDAAQNNMFFWYFEPQVKTPNAPLLIWLQGGPGGSSMFGLFSEMGPYTLVNDSGTIVAQRRPVSWNENYAMLFIDNPVGAGFSFTNNNGYCNDTKECVSRNLYSLLTQFYTVFPEKLHAPLYVTGESYGGHYVPGIAYYIHEQNMNATMKIPLAGVAIGDGWIDPVNMINAYPDMMFNTGLIDEKQKLVIADMCKNAVTAIESGDMLGAFDIWDKMLNGDVWPYGNLFHNMTGLNDYDNYANTNAPAQFGYYPNFLNTPAARASLHVGSTPFPFNPHQCELHLLGDFMVSFQKELSVLLENYKVLVYSGQLDVIIGAALTEAFLPKVQWSGQQAYIDADRAVWRVQDTDAEVAGYVRQVKQFTQVVIRNAGHIAPYDQPERSFDMITRFVENKPYPNLPNPSN